MSTGTGRVALVTYSTKPRGGVIHTLEVAEALGRAGVDVEVIALGTPGGKFFRDVTVPVRLFPAPVHAGTLEQRVFDAVDALADGLTSMGDDLPAVLHTQDCISGRAACRVRDGRLAGRQSAPAVLRTVHHVDDFTTPALIDCQRRAIFEPDRVLVVSATWQDTLRSDYGIDADIVPNGVDVARFAAVPTPEVTSKLRAKVGATDRFLFLAVGGVEPRKGSDHLMRALGALRAETPGAETDRPAVLAIVGGHSFQDHAPYRKAVLDGLPELGLELGVDVVLVGTVGADELHAWYHTSDALTFPSVNEGWGLVVLEAMAAGLPVVATDLPVFREYLRPGLDALLVAPGDDVALTSALRSIMTDGDERDRLITAGRAVADRYGWDASARRHASIYASL